MCLLPTAWEYKTIKRPHERDGCSATNEQTYRLSLCPNVLATRSTSASMERDAATGLIMQSSPGRDGLGPLLDSD